MKNALECLLKEAVRKPWCVLDYIHPRTVKVKNFNGIKAPRKKGKNSEPWEQNTPPGYLLATGRAEKVQMATPIQLHKEDCSLISQCSTKLHFKTSFTILMCSHCWLLPIYANSSKLGWLKCTWLSHSSLLDETFIAKASEKLSSNIMAVFWMEMRYWCFLCTDVI